MTPWRRRLHRDPPSLAGIEKRAAGGTEGDWTADPTTGEVWADPGEPVLVARAGWAEDATFIADARTAVPALTAAVRDVLKAVDEARAMTQGRNARSEPPSHGQVLYFTSRVIDALAARLDLTDPEGDPT